jgi:hypothetical protein
MSLGEWDFETLGEPAQAVIGEPWQQELSEREGVIDGTGWKYVGASEEGEIEFNALAYDRAVSDERAEGRRYVVDDGRALEVVGADASEAFDLIRG